MPDSGYFPTCLALVCVGSPDGATEDKCGASFDRSHELGTRPKLNLYVWSPAPVMGRAVRRTRSSHGGNILCLRLEDTSSEEAC